MGAFVVACGAALALFAGLGLLAASRAGAETLSAAELEKFPVIMQWIYRNSPEKDPLSCGEACSSLWTAEQGVGYSPADKEMWNQIGFFATGNHLWPSLSELSSAMGEVEFGTSAFQVGWHMLGASGKWLELGQVGAGGPPKLEYCGSSNSYVEQLKPPGEPYGFTPESGFGSRPVTRAWTYVAYQPFCAIGQGIGYYQSAVLAGCGISTVHPPAWPYWESVAQHWADCSNEHGLVNEMGALRTDLFVFARPEDYGSQVATKVASTSEPSSVPTPETIEPALKKALEEDATLNQWLKYHLTGEGSDPTQGRVASEELGGVNPGELGQNQPCVGKPVDCATGDEVASQTDLSVGGRGVPLVLTRTYNSQAAVAESTPGPFGYGWASSFGEHLTINTGTGTVTVKHANGSTVVFRGNLSSAGELTAPVWVQSRLVLNGDGTYTYTLPGQQTFHFNSSGRLLSETDRNGNTTSLTYNEAGHLETITDAAGRKMTLTYNSEGHVESAKDPMGHTAKYGYEGGNLTSVTEPGETSPRWRFKYDSSHQLTEEIDGRGGKTVNEYDSSHRVVSQADPLGRTLTFEYHHESEPRQTVITNHATGAVTKELFNGGNELTEVIHGYGTSSATSEILAHNGAGFVTSRMDGNGYATTYSYDAAGDRTSMIDPLGHERRWTYNSTRDVLTSTTPNGETTTIERDSHGNPEAISRPAPGGKTQTTKYKYDSHGDLTSVEDPLKRVWSYEYDSAGDRTSETDPEGDKRTWAYNEDSQATATVAPRGNATGAELAKYTTTIERDAQGRAVVVTEPEAKGASKPANKAKAAISGTAEEAKTLTAAAGIWEGALPLTYTYQWQRCNASGGSCSSVSGATNATYVVVHGDIGGTLRVVVIATNSAGSASSTSEATAVVPPPIPVFASQIGSFGSGHGQLHAPKGLALDGKGNLLVADEENARIESFNEKGEYVSAFGSLGSGNGQLNEPRGVAVDSKGNRWVADTRNNRVEVFNEKGEYQKIVGSLGSGSGQFKEPKGVAVDSHDNVWVADTGNGRVEEFNEKGEYSKAVGSAGSGSGQLSVPRSLAIASNGAIWVTDTGNNRVEVFKENGEYEKTLGSLGSGNGQFFEPEGITFDAHNDVWVADSENNRVQEFTEAGTYLTQFGSKGSSVGQFLEPWGIQIDTHGNIYVADDNNSRIEKYTLMSGSEIASPPIYSSQFGSFGSGHGQLHAPKGLVLDGKGNLLVADEENARIESFNEKGEYVSAFGSLGSGNGQLDEPRGVAIDSKGNRWVADTSNNRVEVFNEKGEYQKIVGSLGTGTGHFKEPKGIAVDSHNNVWVADTGNGRIEEFNEKGEYSKTVGSAGSGFGQLSVPRSLAIASNGAIWVTDTGNDRVEVFKENGEYEKLLGSLGTGNGQFNEPEGITFDSHNNVWVADSENDRIQEFTEAGAYLTQFGSKGTGSGQFEEPWGIQVDTHGNVYVADDFNNRVEKFGAGGGPANVSPPTVSGEIVAGQTVGASTGTWTGVPAPTYVYQWQRCNGSGEGCVSISGATSATYGIGHGDVGSTLRVTVTATNSVGSSASTSAATEAVTQLRTTEYAYDANGNLASVTSSNGGTTKYTYDADDEQTKVTEPNGTVTETGYDGSGQVTSQTNGAKHVTEYVRNPLEQIVEVIDPLKRKTAKEYDKAGNLVKLVDPAKRTTTYAYDEVHHLIEVSYSDGVTPAVKYVYDNDGDLTHMNDGTGETNYTYDQLDRLTEVQNGHKEAVGYEYDLANQQTKVVYPSGKSVVRSFDKAGRLEKVTDWLEGTTKFGYDADSNLTVTTFPSGTGEVDSYAFNEADQMSEVKMSKGSETLASVGYGRDNEGQVKTATQKGLPGEEKPAYEYDANSRLVKGGATGYEYDAADNPTKLGAGAYSYDAAGELEAGPSVKYAFNEVGQRVKATPTVGPVTTYGYDQAGNLTSVARPKEGEAPAIEDGYGYDGDGLRASQKMSGTTSYFAWDVSSGLPLLLGDGTNSYVYGPGGLPVEQLNNTTGTVTYLHHDQAGSTRLLTGSTGTVTGKCTYGAYGTPTCEGTTTTPVGYDGQYTSSDTGLIYMRARVYDPATAQFLTTDPLKMYTGEPYIYVSDNPLNGRDPSGRNAWELEPLCFWPFCGPPPPAVEGVKEIGEGFIEGAKISWQEVEGGWNAVFSAGDCEIPRSAIDAEAALKEIARRHGIPPKVLHDRLDRAKKGAGLTPRDRTRIDAETGEIYDAETGEPLGNVYEH